jgi:hypothetical protein
LTGAVVFVVAVSGVLAVSVPAFAPVTRRASGSGEPWTAQDVTGERRRERQAKGTAGSGWIIVVTATAAIMALIGYFLVSKDRRR